jgi:hypothetical protein
MEENYWVFHSFGNYSGVRGRGAECLQEVCHLADDYSVAMHLWTASPELHPYYERFGFAKSEPPRERAEGIQWFRREPLTERW